MTRLVSVELLEDCLDSTVVKKLHVQPCVDVELMQRLATDAKLQYYPHFPRPYFRIEKRSAYVIQGVIGNGHVRVTFLPAADDTVEKSLCRLLNDDAAEKTEAHDA